MYLLLRADILYELMVFSKSCEVLQVSCSVLKLPDQIAGERSIAFTFEFSCRAGSGLHVLPLAGIEHEEVATGGGDRPSNQ